MSKFYRVQVRDSLIAEMYCEDVYKPRDFLYESEDVEFPYVSQIDAVMAVEKEIRDALTNDWDALEIKDLVIVRENDEAKIFTYTVSILQKSDESEVPYWQYLSGVAIVRSCTVPDPYGQVSAGPV